MWTYVDELDGRWDVVLGRESWGRLYAIFVPARGTLDARQSLLEAAAETAAYAELEELDGTGWHALFQRSVVKPMEGVE